LCIAIKRANSVGKRTGRRAAATGLELDRCQATTEKNGRKAMYIGIGGLILLIILLMILL
jgi:hypothetical protein